jgi:drug/metabolite transporter (DMT)-like permease
LAELFGLLSFAAFSTYVLKEPLRWTDGLGFLLILSGVVVAMLGRTKESLLQPPGPSTTVITDVELVPLVCAPAAALLLDAACYEQT